MSTTQKAAVKQILNQISAVANVTFSEVTSGQGDIQFGTTDQAGSAGVTYPYTLDGQLTKAYVAIDNSGAGSATYSVGSYYYEVVVHEIGHALGLKHPGNYNAVSSTGSPAPYLPTSEDQSPNTVMTYNNDTTQYLETSTDAYLNAKVLKDFIQKKIEDPDDEIVKFAAKNKIEGVLLTRNELAMLQTLVNNFEETKEFLNKTYGFTTLLN